VSNVIEAATDKWFAETVSKLNSDVAPDTPENNLLFSVLPVAANYCKATFLVADAGHKLPAMALLRVLAELTLRVMWVLWEGDPKREPCGTRVRRWWKTSCNEEIKYLNKMLPSASPKDRKQMEDAKSRFEDEIKKNAHPPVGPFYNSMDELPPQIKGDLYPLLFSPFNQAIHPNLWLFTDLVRQEGNERVFLSDPEKPGADAIKICAMTDAFDLLSVVHRHYGWDCDRMKAEYLKIKNNAGTP
jgi:hypothetical protein